MMEDGWIWDQDDWRRCDRAKVECNFLRSEQRRLWLVELDFEAVSDSLVVCLV